MGSTALYNWEGSMNTFIGHYSGYSNTTGYYNSFIGHNAGYLNTTGYVNVFIGRRSGYLNTTGYANVFIGYNAGYSNTTGYNNSFIGYNAGRYLADGSTARTTGNYGLYLGVNTKASTDDTSNEIVIGYDATGNGSNSVTLGNDNILKTISKGNVGIGNTAPSYKLDVNGTGRFVGALTVGAYTLPNTDGSANQVLKTNGSGVLTWQNDSGVDTSAWHKGGDAVTVASNFGTTTNFDLPFIANSTEYGRLYKNGAWSFGETATATSSGSAAIGYGAAAGALYSTSIGMLSQTNALGAIALGNQARGNHSYSICVATKGSGGTAYATNRDDQILFGALTGFDWQTTAGINGMTLNANGQLAVGSSAPATNAQLDVQSTTRAFYPPRMTTSERDTMTGVTVGAIIYNMTTNKHQGWNGTTWNDFY